MQIKHIYDQWVTEISDVDINSLTIEQREKIYHLYKDRKILLFRDQDITNLGLKNFASIFGNVWDKTREGQSGLDQTSEWNHEDNFVENISENGLLGTKEIAYHIDLLHYPTQGIPSRLLYAHHLEGNTAGTRWIDTTQGVRYIDKEVYNFLRTTFALCKAPYTTPWTDTMRRPAMHYHPAHKIHVPLLDVAFINWIEGLEDFAGIKRPEDEKSRFIVCRNWIYKNVIKPMDTNVGYFEHNWQVGDLIAYDNECTMHYRDKFEGIRRLKRVTWDQDWYKFQ